MYSMSLYMWFKLASSNTHYTEEKTNSAEVLNILDIFAHLTKQKVQISRI